MSEQMGRAVGNGRARWLTLTDREGHLCLSGTLEKMLEASGQRSFFFSKAWFEVFVGAVASRIPGSPVAVLSDADAPEVAVPLVRNRSALYSLSNYYSPLFSLISQTWPPSHESIARLVTALEASEPKVRFLRLEPLSDDDEGIKRLLARFQRSRWALEPYRMSVNWFLPLHGDSFQQYWQKRPGRLKNTVARKRKVFNRAGGQVVIAESERDIIQGLEAYERVYASSWKRPEPFPELVRSLVTALCKTGQVRIGVAFVSDVPVAAQLWLYHRGRALIYKLAYDKRYAYLSPGSLLSYRLFQHAIDELGVREIDYLMGNDDYKRDWMTHRRELFGVLACPPCSPGSLGITVRRWGRRLLKRPEYGLPRGDAF